MAEYLVGQVEDLNVDTIDSFPDLTMSDLLDALSEVNAVGGADIMILGKRVNSGKKSREVGAFVAHFEDTEELFEYRKEESDPDSVGDSLEMFQQIFGLAEEPEKVVGFIIRTLE